ncbi:MAG: hypothetical protein Q9174_004625 [Haloplaca sp. 1 TL-2023]
MPSVPLHLPDPERGSNLNQDQNPLPQLLQTPSGLAILELQGTINIPLLNKEKASDAEAQSSSTAVGRLVFPNYDPDDVTESTSWMKRVHLYVGQHQRLTGEVKKLSSPLAVIRRKQAPHSDGEDTSAEVEELEIAEIIYYRVLFSSRPEPTSN